MMIKETEKEHYEVTEFNSRRLQRGEKHCFRANVFQNGNLVDWVWLSVYDIVEILEDERCSISGHEKFSKEVIQSKTWERLWNEYKYYNVIDNFYKGMSTSKGVPYINHINEGINHLENMKVQDNVINAFILHPFVQCVNLKGTYKDCLLTEKELEKHINIFEIEPEIAFELLLYRKYANSYLCREATDNFSIHDAYEYLKNLNNYQTTVKMLIADKLQNFKDFLLYRQDPPRKDFLNQYFTIWLNILANISESTSIRNYIDINLTIMNQPKTKKEYL